MQNLNILFVGYGGDDHDQLCHLLTKLKFAFYYTPVSNTEDAQLFLAKNKVDFVICHPQTLEFMNFIDLVRQNISVLVISPSAVSDFLHKDGSCMDHDISHAKELLQNKATVIRYGDIEICTTSRHVTICDQQIILTPTEYDILLLLASNPKRVFTYELIVDLVWKERYTSYSRKVISNHISNIKRKINAVSNAHQYIASVHGIGYKFIPE